MTFCPIDRTIARACRVMRSPVVVIDLLICCDEVGSHTRLRSSVDMSVTNEMEKSRWLKASRYGRMRIPRRSEDDVQSVSYGCGAPWDDVSAD